MNDKWPCQLRGNLFPVPLFIQFVDFKNETVYDIIKQVSLVITTDIVRVVV